MFATVIQIAATSRFGPVRDPLVFQPAMPGLVIGAAFGHNTRRAA